MEMLEEDPSILIEEHIYSADESINSDNELDQEMNFINSSKTEHEKREKELSARLSRQQVLIQAASRLRMKKHALVRHSY